MILYHLNIAGQFLRQCREMKMRARKFLSSILQLIEYQNLFLKLPKRQRLRI